MKGVPVTYHLGPGRIAQIGRLVRGTVSLPKAKVKIPEDGLVVAHDAEDGLALGVGHDLVSLVEHNAEPPACAR